MTTTGNNEAPFNIDELNGAWSSLLAQLVVSRLAIQKQVNVLENGIKQLNADLDVANAKIEELKAELNQAELNITAAQGKQIIDSR